MQRFDFQTQVSPNSLAREKATQIGLVGIDQLPRFVSATEGSEPLEVSLQYGQDIEGVFIDSLVKVKCQLLCQFCLSTFTYPIHSTTRFRPVLTLEAAREIPAEDEPVLYENGFINIINMIEDDALLAIPNYPKCNDCMNDNKADTFPSQFAILANLDLLPENN
jgi:uncharacterized protein